MTRNLIKRQQNIFRRTNNTFDTAVFIYLGAQLILPHYKSPKYFCEKKLSFKNIKLKL
jgi:hypothetical protein